jgi:hypothetical protein
VRSAGLRITSPAGGGASLRTVQSAAVDGLIINSLSKDAETIRTIADRGAESSARGHGEDSLLNR